MMRQNIPLGRILGIPVGIDYSWFILFVLLTWSLAVTYYPAEFKDWPVAEYWVMGAIASVFLFVSVLLHELGHSIAAMHYQIPVKSITLFIFGGVAQITREPRRASQEFFIALAGPVVSFALAIIFHFLQSVFSGAEAIFALCKYLSLINGMLVLFNLIPGFPLDGGRVFRAIVWGISHNFYKATVMAANVGRFFAFLFIFLGVMQIFAGNVGNGVWIAIIGWFLDTAAMAQVQQQQLQHLLAGHKVRDAMNPTCTTIPDDMTLEQVVDQYLWTVGKRCFVGTEKDKPAGLLTLHQIKDVPKENWSETTVAQAMIPLDKTRQVKPDSDLWEAVEQMNREGVNQLPVFDNGQLVGMLSREDLLHYLQTLKDLAA